MLYLCRCVVVFLCLALVTSSVASTSAAAFKRVKEGDTAPGFQLPGSDGQTLTLEEYREGPLTVLVFWALWSDKSTPLLKDVQALVDELGSHGLRAIGVNAEGADAPADLEQKVASLLAEHGIQFPVAFDKDLQVYADWGVIATPATALLGPELKIEYEFSGYSTSAHQDLRAKAMEILGVEDEKVAAKTHAKRERYQAEKKVLLNYGLSRTLFERGQFAKAGRKLKRVIADDPEYPDAHALDGVIQLGLEREGKDGDPKRARESFAKAVELDPTVPLGLAGLAHFALADGDTAKALELTRTAVDHTETEDLPALAGEGQEAPAAGESAVMAQLERAAAALEAGDGDAARAQLEPVVEALLAIPVAPAMHGVGAKVRDAQKAE